MKYSEKLENKIERLRGIEEDLARLESELESADRVIRERHLELLKAETRYTKAQKTRAQIHKDINALAEKAAEGRKTLETLEELLG